MKSKETKEIEKYLVELNLAVQTMSSDLLKLHHQISKIKDQVFSSNGLGLSDQELVNLMTPPEKKLLKQYEKLGHDRSELMHERDQLTKKLETLRLEDSTNTSPSKLQLFNPFTLFKKSTSVPDNLHQEEKKSAAKSSSMPELKRKP